MVSVLAIPRPQRDERLHVGDPPGKRGHLSVERRDLNSRSQEEKKFLIIGRDLGLKCCSVGSAKIVNIVSKAGEKILRINEVQEFQSQPVVGVQRVARPAEKGFTNRSEGKTAESKRREFVSPVFAGEFPLNNDNLLVRNAADFGELFLDHVCRTRRKRDAREKGHQANQGVQSFHVMPDEVGGKS